MVSDFAKADAGMEAIAARVAEPARNLRRSMMNMRDLPFAVSALPLAAYQVKGNSPSHAAPAVGTAEITGKYDGTGVVPVTHDNRAILNVIEADVYEERR